MVRHVAVAGDRDGRCCAWARRAPFGRRSETRSVFLRQLRATLHPRAGSSRRRRRRRPARRRGCGRARPRGCRRGARTRTRRSRGWPTRRVPTVPRSARGARRASVKPGARVGLWSSARSGSPGSAQVASTYPTSARGSPSVQISQSSTARISPRSSTMQLPRRKSPCTTVLSVCSGMCAASSSCTRSTAGSVARLRRLELRVPPLELAARRARRARARSPSPTASTSTRVERDERVDERIAGVRPGRLVELGDRGRRRRAARCPSTYDIT